MSDKQAMIRIYEQFATKLSSEIINEGIENSVPKIPKLLNNTDIDFLMKQFDRRDWAQAMAKRYVMLFHYLVTLDHLRKEVVKYYKEREELNAQNYYSQPQFARLSKWAKDRKVKDMANSTAKARATQLFPAGETINPKIINRPEFRSANKQELSKIINKINNYYMADNKIEFANFVTGSESNPRSYKAYPHLKDLAKSLEGEFGKPDGFDLHNPRRIARSKDDKPIEPKYITDGFIFPTKKEIEDAIRNKLKDISRGISVPTDTDDEARLVGHFPKREKLVSDEGTSPLEKQLINIYLRKAEENLKAKKKSNPHFNYKRSDVRKEAARLARLKIKNYTYGQFADFLKNQKGISQADVAGIGDVFPNTTIEGIGDKDFIKQINRKTDIPHQKMQITRLQNGKEKIDTVENPVLNKTIMYKDVKLRYPHDTDDPDLTVDTTQTDLVGRGLGEKTFDPILFDRLFSRWKALKDGKIDPNKARQLELILNKHGLSSTSPLKSVVEAAKRFYYQQADPSAYKQGSDVSSTFSHHPLRMSAESKNLNRFHNQADFDAKMDILFKKGCKYKASGQTIPLHVVIKKAVNRFVTPKKDMPLGQALPRLLMGRSKNTLNSLAQERVLGDLGNDRLYMNVGSARAPDYYGDANTIRNIVNKEMKRYFDQNLLAGAARGRGDFIQILDRESEDLNCRQGARSFTSGQCLFGNDIKANIEKASDGYDSATSGVMPSAAGGIIEQRQKIYKAIQGTYEMMQALYAMKKTRFALESHHDEMISKNNQLQTLNAKPTKTQKDLDAIKKLQKEIAGLKSKEREKAIYDITKFFSDNISLTPEQFLNAFYKEYQDDLNFVRASGKNVNLNMPQELAGTNKADPYSLASVEQYKKRLKDKKIAAAQTKNIDTKFMSAIEKNDIAQLAHNYIEQVKQFPTNMEKLYTSLINQIPNPLDKQQFEMLVRGVNQQVQEKLSKYANEDEVIEDLYSLWNLTGNHRRKIGPDILKGFQENGKYISRPLLLNMASVMMSDYGHDIEKENKLFPDDDPVPEHITKEPFFIDWKKRRKESEPYRKQAMTLVFKEIERRNMFLRLAAGVRNPEKFEKNLELINAESRPPKKKAGRPRKNPIIPPTQPPKK